MFFFSGFEYIYGLLPNRAVVGSFRIERLFHCQLCLCRGRIPRTHRICFGHSGNVRWSGHGSWSSPRRAPLRLRRLPVAVRLSGHPDAYGRACDSVPHARRRRTFAATKARLSSQTASQAIRSHGFLCDCGCI